MLFAVPSFPWVGALIENTNEHIGKNVYYSEVPGLRVEGGVIIYEIR